MLTPKTFLLLALFLLFAAICLSKEIKPMTNSTVSPAAAPAVAPVKKPTLNDVIAAIREVETGGHRDPTNALGDHGKSLGPYQISSGYYQDSLLVLHRLNYDVPPYKVAVTSDTWAPEIMKGYWQRWCPEAVKSVDVETLSRVHDGGGPRGMKNDNTILYWRKVQKVLTRKGFSV